MDLCSTSRITLPFFLKTWKPLDLVKCSEMELVDGLNPKPCTTWDGVKGMHWEVEIHYLKRLAEFYPSVFVTNYSRDYCSFKMSTDVISAVGDTAASAFASWRRGLCIGTSLTRDPILEPAVYCISFAIQIQHTIILHLYLFFHLWACHKIFASRRTSCVAYRISM